MHHQPDGGAARGGRERDLGRAPAPGRAAACRPLRRGDRRPPVDPRRPGASRRRPLRRHDRARLPDAVDAARAHVRGDDGSDPRMGINYGIEKIRFTAPVPVGSEVRLHAKLASAERRGKGSSTASASGRDPGPGEAGLRGGGALPRLLRRMRVGHVRGQTPDTFPKVMANCPAPGDRAAGRASRTGHCSPRSARTSRRSRRTSRSTPPPKPPPDYGLEVEVAGGLRDADANAAGSGFTSSATRGEEPRRSRSPRGDRIRWPALRCSSRPGQETGI